MHSRAERRRLLVPPPEQLDHIAAGAYAGAVLAGAPMQRVVDVIEPLRAAGRQAQDAYALGRNFDAALCRAASSPLQPVLTTARDGYYDAVAQQAMDLVRQAAASSPSEGLATWLRAAGEAFGEDRAHVCRGLCRDGAQGGIPQSWPDLVLTGIDAASVSAWHRVLPVLERLLGEEVWEDRERAPLVALSSLIQCLVLRDAAAGRRLADEAVRLWPDGERGCEALALNLLDCGQRDAAEALLSAHLERDPDSGPVHSAYGRCARIGGDLALAEQRLLVGLDRAPHAADVLDELLQVYSDQRWFAEHESQLARVAAQSMAVDPESAYETTLTLACAYRDGDMGDGGRSLLEEAIARHPERTRAHVELAVLDAREEQYDSARARLTTAWGLDPEDGYVAAVRAAVEEAAGDLAAGIEWARRSVELALGSAGPDLAALALLEQSAGDLQAAWTTAGRAIAADPSDLSVVDQLGDLLAAQWATDPQDVRTLLDEVLQARGVAYAAQYHLTLGDTALAAGDAEAAVAEYAQAVEDPATRPEHRLAYARALRTLGRWDEALASLVQAETQHADPEECSYERAMVHNERGNRAYSAGLYEEAVADYELAVRALPGDAVLWANLAGALQETALVPGRRLERLGRAVEALREATRLAPQDAHAVRLSQLEAKVARIGRFTERIEVSADVVPLVVEVADDLVPSLDPEQHGAHVFDSLIPRMREELGARLGFPSPHVRIRPGYLPAGEYRILVHGIPRTWGWASAREECVQAPLAVLREHGLVGAGVVEVTDAVTGTPCVWAAPAIWEGVTLDGLARLSDVDVLLRHVAATVADLADAFFDLDTARRWSDALDQQQEGASDESGGSGGSGGEGGTGPAAGPGEDSGVGPGEGQGGPTDGSAQESVGGPVVASAGEAPTKESQRSAAHRQLALLRALRCCVRDGMRVDRELRDTIREFLARTQIGDNEVLSVAAAAFQDARRAFPDRLPTGEPVALPSWVDEQLARGIALSPQDEHRLLTDEATTLGLSAGHALVTGVPAGRAYLQRLLDGPPRPPGAPRAVVLDRDEAAGRVSRRPAPALSTGSAS